MNSSVVYAIILAAMNIIEYLFLNIFLSHYLEKKPKCFRFYWFGVVFAGMLTLINMQQDLVKNICMSYILMLMTAVIVYQGKTSKKFAFASVFVTLSALSEVILTFIASIVAVAPIEVTIESITTYIFSGVGGKFILFFIIRYLIKKYSNFYQLDRERDIILLSLFPISAFAATHVILEFDRRLGIPFSVHLLTIGLLILFLFLSVSIFFIYQSALHNKQLENELLLNEEIKITSQKVFNQQIETVNKISAIQHEYNRHINTIVGCIAEKRYDDLNDYIQLAMQDANKYSIPIPVDFKNFAFNSLYGRFVQQCTDYDISLVTDIRYRNFAFLSDFDASIIWGNLFDNALDACAKVTQGDRFIEFTILLNNNFAVITLSNSYQHKIVNAPKHDALLSTRRDYLSEGHGIKNIQSTLIKYNGYYSYTYNNNKFTSIIRIDSHTSS